MLYVKAKVAPSSIHNVGLFAVEHIPTGTLISRWTPGFDQDLDARAFASLPESAREFIRTHGFQLANGAWRRDCDAAAYVNHSNTPNTRVEDDGDSIPTYALRDIAAGEEITEDYRQWNPSFDGFAAESAPADPSLVDAARKLVEFIDEWGVEVCNEYPVCADDDEPKPRAEWCKWCSRLDALRSALESAPAPVPMARTQTAHAAATVGRVTCTSPHCAPTFHFAGPGCDRPIVAVVAAIDAAPVAVAGGALATAEGRNHDQEGTVSASLSDGDLRAYEVNARKVVAGAPASAKHWAGTTLRVIEAAREAREWVGRLTAQTRVLTCAFCGEAYPPGTPASNHDLLTAHVKLCAKHPLRPIAVAGIKMLAAMALYMPEDMAPELEAATDELAAAAKALAIDPAGVTVTARGGKEGA